MGVNIFAPAEYPEAVYDIVELANKKAKGRFDWCEKFVGPGGWALSLEEALAFNDEEAPWWVLVNQKMVKVKNREHWQQLLRDSGCPCIIFLKARL